MKLNLNERFTVLSILPKEGNFATLKIIRDLQGVLAPSEEEHKEFELVINKQTGRIEKYNEKINEQREILVGEKATDVIVEALKELDRTKKLTPVHVSLWEKFIGD